MQGDPSEDFRANDKVVYLESFARCGDCEVSKVMATWENLSP